MGIPGLVEALSERELEVLRLLAAGKPNREIAGELYVAVDTVKKHGMPPGSGGNSTPASTFG